MDNKTVTMNDTLAAQKAPGCENDFSDNMSPIIEPQQQQLPALPEYGFDALSLYTGVGGLDLGVHQASDEGDINRGHIRVKLAVDNWSASQLNYPLAFQGDFLCKDILDVSADEILERAGKKRGDFHSIFGGPPCPGWSAANRKRNEGDASLLETNILTFKFISLISEIQPLNFCMEQVDGLGDQAVINGFHELKMRFKEELKNYIIQAREIPVLYLGIPQNRTRWIFVGWRRDTGILPVFPKPIKGSLAHLTIGAIAPEIDHVEIKGSRILRKEFTEFFSTIPATEGNVLLKMKDGSVEKLSNRPDLLLKIFGYPEDFKLHPDLSFAQIHRLIGNSVPPPLAKAVFTEIVRQLRSLHSA